jgi:RNA polymerase sigma-70 factor (ECF subfamily)
MATMTTDPATSLQEVFVLLVREHEPLLHKVCHLYCRNEDERRDLLQEMLLQVWRSLPGFDERAKPGTWIYRVALNTAITFLRKRARSVPVDALPDVPDAGCEAREFRQVEHAEVLERAIATLSSVEKAALLLHFEERSYLEIGEILGISEKAVSVKLVRIKTKLRDWFQRAR